MSGVGLLLSFSPQVFTEIARSCLSKYQKLHQVYRLCHGDVHAGNIMVSNVPREALVTATGEKPFCARNLFPRPEDETPLGVAQVELSGLLMQIKSIPAGAGPLKS